MQVAVRPEPNPLHPVAATVFREAMEVLRPRSGEAVAVAVLDLQAALAMQTSVVMEV